MIWTQMSSPPQTLLCWFPRCAAPVTRISVILSEKAIPAEVTMCEGHLGEFIVRHRGRILSVRHFG